MHTVRLACCLVLSLVTCLLVGCGEDKTASRDGATIVVGTEPTFAPFEMRDENGNIIGFDIDLVRAIAEKQGLKVEFKDFGFDALIPALQSGQIDLIASGMSITEERRKVIDFSDPYIEAGLVLAVQANEQAIKGPDDLKGKVAAVQRGSTGASEAERLKNDGVLKDIKYYPTVPLAMMELAKGGADVVINDRPTSEAYVAAQGQQLRLLPDTLVSDQYGFAIRKGNTELLNKVNEGLKQVQAEGLIDQLRAKYFTHQAATQPAS